MDLLFDVQIARMPPEQAVVVISAYYNNATIKAYPMNRLIGLAMLVTAGGALFELARGRVDRRLAAAAAAAALVPVGLALARVVPNAMLLGDRSGSAERQIALAWAIFLDHVLCLTMMVAFIAIEIVVAAKARHARTGS